MKFLKKQTGGEEKEVVKWRGEGAKGRDSPFFSLPTPTGASMRHTYPEAAENVAVGMISTGSRREKTESKQWTRLTWKCVVYINVNVL